MPEYQIAEEALEKEFASKAKNIEIHKELDIKEKIKVPYDDKVKQITPKWSATKKGKTFKIEDSDGSNNSSDESESDGSSSDDHKDHYVVKETKESIDIDQHVIDDKKPRAVRKQPTQKN